MKNLLSLIVWRARWACVAAITLATGGLSVATAADYVQTNLASNIPGLAAITDPLLLNPWGVSRSPTSPFWVSNQGTNSSRLFAVTGGTSVSQVLTVNANGFVGIPTTAGGPQGPTGQVNNTNTASFRLVPSDSSTSARFIFANLNGTISGWAGGLTSTVEVATPGAVYTGLAINSAQTRLYAAGAAGINVFDSAFAPVSLSGGFTDPNLPSGFVPFNVQNISGNIYVTYAPDTLALQRGATAGAGFVDVFNDDGVLQQRLISGNRLAAPWGLALAPADFGVLSGSLLVGNFSFAASEINAFDPVTGAFRGTIPVNVGAGNTPGGLWALTFGSGAGNGGAANILYFTDGINGETAGLFGAIAAVPEPATYSLLALGLVVVGFVSRRRRARES